MGLLGQKGFKKCFLKPDNPLKNYLRNKRLENVDDEVLHQRLKEQISPVTTNQFF